MPTTEEDCLNGRRTASTTPTSLGGTPSAASNRGSIQSGARCTDRRRWLSSDSGRAPEGPRLT